MIQLKNVNKYYHSKSGDFHALKDINLTLPDKGMVYIVGKSGSGKSTLLNIIGGIDQMNSGDITLTYKTNENGNIIPCTMHFGEFNKSTFNAYRNGYIGFIFQEFNVIKSLTVFENVALSLELKKENPKKKKDEIYNILAKVGLKGKENRRINELSGGERQRVAIARALIKNPYLIIADEPTGNLDRKNRDIVMDILKDLSKDRLVLIVTHDTTLSHLYGDREITIKDGEIVKDEVYNEDILKEDVISNYKFKNISPKANVSFHLALKGFKLNLMRFIFILLLFGLSLVFAGAVVNFYLADPTYEYAKFQEAAGNNVITLSDQYNYHGKVTQTAFFNYELTENKKIFSNSSQPMSTYTSMKYDIPINQNEASTNYLIDNEFFFPTISSIIRFNDATTFEKDFKLTEDYSINQTYRCYITDYVAKELILADYFNTSVSLNNITGKSIRIPGISSSIVIAGVIDTNYEEFIGRSLTNTERAVFYDNLSIYNAIYVSDTVYQKLFTAGICYSFTDDILFYDAQKTEAFDDVTFSYAKDTDTYLAGRAPEKPKSGEVVQIAVSKGFVEKVLKTSVSMLTWTSDSKISKGTSAAYNFYLCGVSRIPMSMEFTITGIIDTDIVACFTPALGKSTLFQSWINTSFIEGGFLTTIVSQDLEENAKTYRALLNNKITIDNPSFVKLMLVDNFINDNIYLFAALFFSFALFSILLIFNFIIISIKNSTRDIGIYMSLGMNGKKISLIYLFQVLLLSTASIIIGILGSSIFLLSVDASFSSLALIDFTILKITFTGILFILGLGIFAPLLSVLYPLCTLMVKRPIDVLKIS